MSRIWIVITSLTALISMALTGIVVVHHKRMQRAAIEHYLSLELEAVKKLAVTNVHMQATRGIYVAFTEPIYAVDWSLNGRAHETTLKKPTKAVWLKVALPQGTHESINVTDAVTIYKQRVAESWHLSDETPPPLHAVTNPGIWQLDVARKGPYSIHFNAPIRKQVDLKSEVSFNPPIPGHWKWKDKQTAAFYPLKKLPPNQEETMVLHGGTSGPRSTAGQYLSSDVNRSFITHSNEKIVIREKQPEVLTLYKNGKPIFKSLCNTGVPGAATPTGTFYIRSKFRYAAMRGTEPNGQPYFDPHVPWVMGLFGNVAIHGYKREKYGFPQSVGCAELPIAKARRLYSLVKLGTPVEIVKA